MPVKFTSREKRDELTRRLIAIAEHMQRSFDQGYDGRISVSDEMIGDILAAAGCVGTCDISGDRTAGGKARAAALSPKRRREIASAAAYARWGTK